MGQRMFVAVYPPLEICEELAEFLQSRPGMRWSDPEQLHVTLAFLPEVPDRAAEPLEDLIAEACAPVPSFVCGIHGAGAFPHADRPAVLWLGVEDGAEELSRLSRRVRSAANRAGVAPDGKAFTPHLTVARPPRSENATRWIRVLETFRPPLWTVQEVHLVESVLQGHGHRPRHRTVMTAPLGT
jgi:2'-5' RNA ligase